MSRKRVKETPIKVAALSLPRPLLWLMKLVSFAKPPRSAVQGRIKWFDNKKGFGFIARETGQDVFVHHSAIVGKGFKTLSEGDSVTFEIIESSKGLKAANVRQIRK